MSEPMIPERWRHIWKDWTEESKSCYAWKETAMRAVEELGAAEAKIVEQSKSIDELTHERERLTDKWSKLLDKSNAQTAIVARLTEALSEFYTQVTIDDILSKQEPK